MLETDRVLERIVEANAAVEAKITALTDDLRSTTASLNDTARRFERLRDALWFGAVGAAALAGAVLLFA